MLEKPGTAKCGPYCKPGKPCTVLSETMSFDVKEHVTMFCFALRTKNTGSTKKSWEKELLAGVHAKRRQCFRTRTRKSHPGLRPPKLLTSITISTLPRGKTPERGPTQGSSCR